MLSTRAKLLSITSRQRSNRIYLQRTSISICQPSSQQKPPTMGMEQSYHSAFRTDPKAIYLSSRALTPTLQNYSQIEKEALALLFAVQNFHRFVHACHFTLKTDHKPLLPIFGCKKGVPVYSANRLQRWATALLNYNFTIDCLSQKNM
ncbi:hypothetical protein ANCCEY_10039 [Ancylostoma ceylanicum]|uniref:Reverse transcriptase RNase H-like domain-containing protein n=2 Tax=Ancylostoma ceylanicum TaxID=53326 RepID=A0A0D6LLJ2_9BILA|nr:hypothetical protein ANCCEY_10039 [Ancylostoma ceylanicum]EYC26178.1 hypothetical protein Y032_0010g1003 [Ancylostoma ceylanicum]